MISFLLQKVLKESLPSANQTIEIWAILAIHTLTIGLSSTYACAGVGAGFVRRRMQSFQRESATRSLNKRQSFLLSKF